MSQKFHAVPTSDVSHKIPKVSLGMPVYNGENFIREALDSLLAQTFTDFELIISDNASTDKTEEICRSYADRDRRIKYIRQEINKGGFFNFNYLLNSASGEYFTWVAHDDFLDHNFLKEMIAYLDQHPDVAICSCDFRVVDREGNLIKYEYLEDIYSHKAWAQAQKGFFYYPTSNIYLAIYGVFRLSIFRKYNIGLIKFWDGLAANSELPFLSRVATKGKIVSIPSVLRTYRRHNDSVYHQEYFKTSTLRRMLHKWTVRFDQVYVLFTSQMSFFRKMGILIKMARVWVKNSFHTTVLTRMAVLRNLFRKILQIDRR